VRRAAAGIALIAGLAASGLVLAQDDPFGDVPDYVQLRSYLDQDVYRAGGEARIALELRIDPRVHVNSQAPVTDFQYPTSLAWEAVPEGLELSEVEWPKPALRAFEFTDGEKIDVWEGTVRAFLTAKIPDGAEGALRIQGTFKAQGCTETVCYAPQTDPVRLTIRIAEEDEEPERINEAKFAPAGGEEQPPGHEDATPAPVEIAALGPDGADGPGVGEDCDTVSTAKDLDKPLPLLFLLSFLGGLGLTLTPCVLPLVPITIGYFSRQSTGGGRPVGLAAVYVLGLAFVYSALGTVAALTGNLFGSALQEPLVLIAIAAILVGLSLSMFGLWDMQLPASFTSRLGGARAGYAGAAVMGGAMGLIAAPCVGPFVVSLLTYVAKVGADPEVATGLAALLGGSLFFALALGLGTPFFLVGIGVASVNPGQWMESVKKVFGFLILGVALWFLRPLLPEAAFPAGVVALALAMGVFLLLPVASAGSPRLRLPFRVLGIASLAGAVGFAALILRPAPASGHAFAPYSAERLAEARTAGRPVVIDFWAEWCIACKELEHETFTDARVRDALSEFVLIQADLTDEADPTVKQLYRSYDIKGLPTVVFLDRSGQEVRDLRLTEFEPPEEFTLRVHCVEAVAVAAR
jgi:thiol:disulfide interchange protein DsbD